MVKEDDTVPEDEHVHDDAFDDYAGELDESSVHHVDAVDLRSLGVVSGLFYFTAFLVLALAIAGVWLLAAGLGLISQLEEFMRSIGFRGFRLVGPEVVLGFVLLLGALVVFLTVMTLIAGAFYNLLGSSRRGVRVRLSPVHPEADAEPSAEEAVPPAPTVIEPVADADDDEAPADGGRSDDETKPAAAAG